MVDLYQPDPVCVVTKVAAAALLLFFLLPNHLLGFVSLTSFVRYNHGGGGTTQWLRIREGLCFLWVVRYRDLETGYS